ncbi:MAG: hypothetical protein KDA21_13080 [Phycisphaerales bacterium]|nr:hypothetical protein [Phycisphaerales bacterium]
MGRHRRTWLRLALLLVLGVTSTLGSAQWIRTSAAVRVDDAGLRPSSQRLTAYTGPGLWGVDGPSERVTMVGWPILWATWDNLPPKDSQLSRRGPDRVSPVWLPACIFVHAVIWHELLYAAGGLWRLRPCRGWSITGTAILLLAGGMTLTCLTSWVLALEADDQDMGRRGQVSAAAACAFADLWPDSTGSVTARATRLPGATVVQWIVGPRLPYDVVTRYEVGRPWRGMTWHRVSQAPVRGGGDAPTVDPGVWVGGVNPPAFVAEYATSDHIRLPIQPIWTGFALNTLFYASVLALVTAGGVRTWSDIVVAVRQRRGRCVACGYDSHGLERCPECGGGGTAHRVSGDDVPRCTT